MVVAPTTQHDFLESLRQSRLVSEEHLQLFLEAQATTPATPEELAKGMVRAALLTRFQSRHLLAGRWRGLSFGDYTILDSLSVGGMAEIFTANQHGTNRQVAIKVLRQRYREHPQVVERFRLEAKLLTTLSHPHLLKGIEQGKYHDELYHFWFLCTELIAGPNLYEWLLLKQRIPWQWSCEIIRQAALALQYVHQLSFVHRDIKPGNLIISPAGIVKVSDFGISQYNGQDPEFTEFSERGLTKKRYTAPEQLHREHDPRVDIFALGKTFFYALTGKSPDLEKDLTLARRIHRDLPTEIDQIYARMTNPEAARRFGSMQEVAEALSPFCHSFTVDLDYPALLEARRKARRMRQKGESRTRVDEIGAVPAAEKGRDAPPKPVLDLLIQEAAQQLSSSRDQNLQSLRELAETRRTQSREKNQVQLEILQLRKELEESRNSEVDLRERVDRERDQWLRHRKYLEEQLSVLAADNQRLQEGESRALAESRAEYQATFEQLTLVRQHLKQREQEASARELELVQWKSRLDEETVARQQADAKQEALIKSLRQSFETEKKQRQQVETLYQDSQQTLAALRQQMLQMEERTRWLTEQIFSHASGVAALPRSPSSESNASLALAFWQAYEEACRREADDPLEQAYADSDYLEEISRQARASNENP